MQSKPDSHHIEWPDPYAMLLTIDDDIISGNIVLYDWQIKFLQQFGAACLDSSIEKPNLALLCANNGAGKDLLIIGPTTVWYLERFPQAVVGITTSSGNQLSTQTEPSIKRLAYKLNRFYEAFGVMCDDKKTPAKMEIKQRHVHSSITDSNCYMIATDDEGKAEGFHPVGKNKMLLINNEGKSIAEDIYQARRRCHGYTDWLDVSSAGEETGSFYKAAMSDHVKLKTFVTFEDCPHISRSEFERNVEEYGINHPFIQSSYFSKFVSKGTEVVITANQIKELQARQKANKIHLRKIRISVGLDLSAVCDETVLTAYAGAEFILSKQRSGFPNLYQQELWLVEELTKLDPDVIPIDYDGLGRPIADNLIHKYKFDQVITRHFGGKPRRGEIFVNKGAEMWGFLARLIAQGLIQLDFEDAILIQQLSTRRCSTVGGKTKLESKKDAKKRGVKSPDRADSLVLAMSGYDFRDFVNEHYTTEEPTKQDSQLVNVYDWLESQRKLSTQPPQQTWANLWI